MDGCAGNTVLPLKCVFLCHSRETREGFFTPVEMPLLEDGALKIACINTANISIPHRTIPILAEQSRVTTNIKYTNYILSRSHCPVR